MRTVISISHWKRKRGDFACLCLSASSDHDFKLIWAKISSPNKLLLLQWRAEVVLNVFSALLGSIKAKF